MSVIHIVYLGFCKDKISSFLEEKLEMWKTTVVFLFYNQTWLHSSSCIIFETNLILSNHYFYCSFLLSFSSNFPVRLLALCLGSMLHHLLEYIAMVALNCKWTQGLVTCTPWYLLELHFFTKTTWSSSRNNPPQSIIWLTRHRTVMILQWISW